VVPVRKKKKENVVGNYLEGTYLKWALVNRVKLNLYCSNIREALVGCKLDRVKNFKDRPGQAKNVYFSVAKVVNLFARVSDAWDLFEEAICCKLKLSSVTELFPKHVASESSPMMEANCSVLPLITTVSPTVLRPGRGRAVCV
jgi:hypothetical protein